MKIRLNSLKEGKQTIKEILSAQDLHIQDESLSQPIEAILSIDKGSSEIKIDGTVNTTGNFFCDRCLINFKKEIESALHLILSQINIEDDAKAENFIHINSNDAVVDISDQMRDTLLLNLPMKQICSDRCKGLCPQCGVNLNHEECKCSHEKIDPRWEALKKLKTNKTEEQ